MPSTIIGYRRNGSPIYVIAGGSEPATSTSMNAPFEDEAEPSEATSAPEPPAPTADDIARLQKALDKERQRAKAGESAAKELERLRASQLSETEKQLAAVRDETAREVSAKYTQRLAGLSIRAAAGGKFQNPEDAVALLSARLPEFVNDDGDVDDKAVTVSVDQLLKERPYLGTQKPPADFDGGQRTGTTGVVDMDALIRGSVRR
jgi:NADH dehydrogenase/NADH:ubiquinone oxidoreductase subunit G